MWEDVIKASSGDVRRLTSVWRYSSIPIVCPENVADHSFWVALYSVMIHQTLQRLNKESEQQYLNGQKVLLAIVLKAITHDISEAVTGDLVRPFKYSSTELKEAIDKAERKMMPKLGADVLAVAALADTITKEMPPVAEKYTDAVVKAADFLSLYQFMRREILRGNLEIHDFVGRMMQDFLTMHKDYSVMPPPAGLLCEFYKALNEEAAYLYKMVTDVRGSVP